MSDSDPFAEFEDDEKPRVSLNWGCIGLAAWAGAICGFVIWYLFF